MTDLSELRDRLGPGHVAATRPVVFKCRWPGKKDLLVGNFTIASSATEAEMRAEAAKMIAAFVADHLPDSIAAPEILEIVPGALRWVPDCTEWTSGIGSRP